MYRKFKLAFVISVIILVPIFTIAAARDWNGPLAQTGMDMPTETMQPQSTASVAATQLQATPTPLGINTQQGMPGLTMTSIFTGFTPDPNTMSTSYSSLGGCGMMAGGMMGSSSGMSTGGNMGTSGMGMTGVMTGTTGMTGMGSMGTGAMSMNGCPMMSGKGMTGDDMSGMDMTGEDMSGNYSITGMDMSDAGGYVERDSSSVFSDPWLLLGWVLLVLVFLAILVGVAFGIVWLIRRPRQI